MLRCHDNANIKGKNAKMPQQCKFKRENANITRQFANLTVGKR
jgi:hypothetical protein